MAEEIFLLSANVESDALERATREAEQEYYAEQANVGKETLCIATGT